MSVHGARRSRRFIVRLAARLRPADLRELESEVAAETAGCEIIVDDGSAGEPDGDFQIIPLLSAPPRLGDDPDVIRMLNPPTIVDAEAVEAALQTFLVARPARLQ